MGGAKKAKSKGKVNSRLKGREGRTAKPGQPQPQAGSVEFDRACIARIQPFWETLSAHSRMDLLSIPVAAAPVDARGPATTPSGPPLSVRHRVTAVLPASDSDYAMRLQRQHRTWKVWTWPDAMEFLSPQAFGDWVWEHDVDPHLRHLRPRHDVPATPAQQALWQRMRQLLERVQGIWQSAQPSRRGRSRTETEPAEIVQLILDALKGEETCLVCAILAVVLAFVSEYRGGELPATMLNDPSYKSIRELPPVAISELAIWLTAKVKFLSLDSLSSLSDKDAAEGIVDFDLLTISEDGKHFPLNKTLVQHLEGQDRKSCLQEWQGHEDPYALLLEFVFRLLDIEVHHPYGAAGQHLGTQMPTRDVALDDLVAALKTLNTLKEQHSNKYSQLTKRQLKDVEQRMEQVHAAVVHLDSELQLVACFDIGFMVGTANVLPLLQDKLNAKAAAFALAQAQKAQDDLLMEEELAERRRFEQNRRQRLKRKSQGKEQDAMPGTAGASKEPAGEEREALSTPSLPDLDGRPLKHQSASAHTLAHELLPVDDAELQTWADDASSGQPGACIPGSVDDHSSGGEAGGPATAPAALGQPSAVDGSRHGHGSSPLVVDDRGPAAPAVEHNKPAIPAVVLEEPAAAAVVWVSETGSRPPAANLDDGFCGHRPGSAPESVTTAGEHSGQQSEESSAKPKPKTKPRPRLASGPVFAPEPLVTSADAAESSCQQECVICMDQPKSVLLAPCGHIVACLRCAEDHYGVDGCLALEANMSCLLCRKLIRATVEAIYS